MPSFSSFSKLAFFDAISLAVSCKRSKTSIWLVQYRDKEIEHKAVKKKWDFSFGRFIVNVGNLSRQVIINTTSSYCLPFKICANKLDLKSLNVLKLDGLQSPPKLLFLTIFF